MSEETANKRLAKGDRLGKYEVLEYVATGGMGTVYKGRDLDLNRIVALKVLTPALAKQPKMLDRFRREARAAARLQHENIVAIYEFGEQDGQQFLALEYVPGIDLQEYVEKRHQLPPDEARQIVVQAARALVHVHEQQVVHRDIKPSNFLLTRKDGRLVVKLTDLGLAIHPSDEEFRLTRIGTTVGTVDYMAPEQARDSGSADIRSDIYSLGCTFYHILGGAAPFAQGTMAERLLQHLQDEAPDVRRLNKEVPPGYVAILQRMLAKQPEERYQTPQELLRDLEDPDAVAAPPRSTPRSGPRSGPRSVPAAKKAPVAARESGPPIPIPAAPGTARVAARSTPAPEAEPEPLGEEEPDEPEERSRPRRTRTPKPAKAETRDARATRDPPVRDPDETRDPPAKRGRSSGGSAKSAGVPGWLFLVLGGVAFGGVVLIAILIAARPAAERKKSDTPPPPTVTQNPVLQPVDSGKRNDDKPQVAGNAAEMGVAVPGLPALYEPTLPVDAAALRREVYGPFASATAPPANAPVLRVGRGTTAGTNAYRSLAEALAAAPAGASIIEIHDRGPLFVDRLPSLDGRDVVVRAGPGFRPLLAWDPPRSTVKQPEALVLLAQRRGQLRIEGLDVVVKWTDAQADRPATLFHSAGGRLELRDCTFSFAGKQPHGIVLARLERGEGEAIEPTRLVVAGCYARGTDLTALAAQGTSADVLIDHSLLVGNVQPLVRLSCRDEDEIKLRIVRSTLVTAQNLIQVRDVAGKGGSPRLQVLAWDALLARNDPNAPEGELLRLAGGAEPGQVRWQAVNSIYAGWKKLLASDTRTIDTLDAWHARWNHREDRAVPETWPHNPPTQLDDLPASVFWTHDTPVGFAAQSGSGPLGAVIGRLSPEPTGWLARTFERPPLTLVGVAPDPGVPEIDPAGDGLYHGEALELPVRADLGVVLAKALHGKHLAARVVFKITGSGDHPCTPVRVQDVQELVLSFERGKAGPLVLTVDPKGVLVDRPALIEVQGGSLELHGAQVRFENSKSAVMPPYIVKVAGGSLLLHRCRLEGPLGKATDAFRALCAIAGPNVGLTECRISDCVLLSGKGVLHTSGVAVKVSARQNVILTLGDALQPDLTGLSDAPAVTWQLESNTWALRRALIAPRAGAIAPGERVAPILVQAVANYFTDPFGDPAPQATLLKASDELLGRGALTWQGRGNGFDRRLPSYYAPGKQTLADWLALWGRTAEADALVVEPGPAAKATVNPDAPQLDRLALPREVRPEPGNPPPGADLARLGLLKKKG